MAVEAKAFVFQIPTTTGVQTITGLPFQPKGIILIGIHAIFDTGSGSWRELTAAADGTNQWCAQYHDLDAQATQDVYVSEK